MSVATYNRQLDTMPMTASESEVPNRNQYRLNSTESQLYVAPAANVAYVNLFLRNPQPLFVVSKLSLQIIAANPAAVKRYAFCEAELLSRTFPQLCRHPRPETLRALFLGLQEEGAIMEQTHLTADSTTLFVEITAWPVEFIADNSIAVAIHVLAEKSAHEGHRAVTDSTPRIGSIPDAELLHPMSLTAHTFATATARVGEELPLLPERFVPEALAEDENDILELFGDKLGSENETTHGFDGHISRAEIDLNSLVERALMESGANLRQAGVTANLRKGKDIPSFLADADRLEEALIHLVTNAREAFDRLGIRDRVPKVTLTTFYDPKQNLIGIQVSDNGPGIAPRDLECIFDPGYTGRPYSRSRGLGLYIARAIAEAHGGSLTVTSALGSNATFTMTLPVIQ